MQSINFEFELYNPKIQKTHRKFFAARKKVRLLPRVILNDNSELISSISHSLNVIDFVQKPRGREKIN